ncbi:MAG TPA: hypothetical protein VI643_03340 [Planctomycetota bacterium]|nr:hypothetical protein [Planctomycetota bacterium]
MGSEINYCNACGEKVLASQIEAGDAVLHDLKPWCPNCLDQLLVSVTADERKQILLKIRKSIKAANRDEDPSSPTPRPRHTPPPLPVQRSTERKLPSTSPKDPVAQGSQPLRPRRGLGTVAAVSAGLALLGSGFASGLLLSSGRTPSVPAAGTPSSDAPIAAPSVVGKTAPSPPRLGMLEAARSYAKANPSDLEGIVSLYGKAVEETRGTPLSNEVEADLAKFDERLAHAIEGEAGKLREILDKLLVNKRFGTALLLCERERSRFRSESWTSFVDERAAEFERRARRALEALELEARSLARRGKWDEALAAVKQAEEFGVESLTARVHGLRLEVEALARAASTDAGATPAPDPDPTPKKDPAEAAKQRKLLDEAFAQAVRKAVGRDYKQALQALKFAQDRIEDEALVDEAEADVRAFELARSVYETATDLLVNLEKGAAITLRYLNEDQKAAIAKGELAATSPTGITIKLSHGKDVIAINFTAILADDLIALFSKRPGADDEADQEAVGAFALLEGDLKCALKLLGADLGGLAEKYRGLERFQPEAAGPPAPAPKRSVTEIREEEAKKLFDAAEKAFAGKKYAAALAAYRELNASRYRRTKAFKDNSKLIQERLKHGTESAILGKRLTGRSYWDFQKIPGCPLDEGWLYTRTYSSLTRYYLETDFFAQEGIPYRIWILIGGDSKENSTFYMQCTDAVNADGKSADIGQPNYITLGPLAQVATRSPPGKVPIAWGWVGIYTKFAKTGQQKVRIAAVWEGAGVAAVIVSAGDYYKRDPDPAKLKPGK